MLLAAVIVEACRAKAWEWLPKWYFMDMTRMTLVGTAAGGEIGWDLQEEESRPNELD